MQSSGVLDTFFWAMTALATLGAFADFLIGASGGKRLTDRLETWWLTFNEVEWRSFGRKETGLVVAYIDRRAGTLFSWKRLRLVGTIVGVTTGIVLIWQVARTMAGVCEWQGRDWQYAPLGIATSVIFTALAISFTRWTSVVAGKLSVSPWSTFIAFAVLLLLHLAVFVYWSTFLLFLKLIVEFMYQAYKAPNANAAGETLLIMSMVLGDSGFGWLQKILTTLWQFFTFSSMGWNCAVFSVTLVGESAVSLLVAVGRIGFALAFVLSFVARPLIQRPISLLVARIVEYRLGFGKVLGGCAAGAKIIQEIAKRLA